VIASKNWT